MFNKRKYYAVFTVNQLELPVIIGNKRISPISKSVRFRNNTFIINIENPTYIKGNKVFYFFSLTSQLQLLFYKTKESGMNSEIIDTIISQRIIQQLTTNLDTEWKMNTSMILIGFIIGALLGYIVSQYLISKQV